MASPSPPEQNPKLVQVLVGLVSDVALAPEMTRRLLLYLVFIAEGLYF